MPVLTGYCGSPLPVEEQIAWLARLRSLVLRLDAEAGLEELVALGPGDLLVRGNAYLLHVRLGKGAKGRLAPVVDREVAFELARYTRDRIEADTLFGVTATFLANYARRCGEETGIPFHAHRCRHTFATELLRSGVALDVVQEALGHADIDTTRTYARTAPQALLRLGFHER